MVRILSFGYDRNLLRIRHQSLEMAGFKVVSVTNKEATECFLLAKRFQVLIVGHAVPVKERIEVSLLAKSLKNMQVICFYLGSIRQAESADAILSLEGTSEDLILAIHRLVNTETAGFSCSAS